MKIIPKKKNSFTIYDTNIYDIIEEILLNLKKYLKLKLIRMSFDTFVRNSVSKQCYRLFGVLNLVSNNVIVK